MKYIYMSLKPSHDLHSFSKRKNSLGSDKYFEKKECLIQDGRECVLRMISAILAASSCPAQFPTHETISEMPFGFWYILQVSFNQVKLDFFCDNTYLLQFVK